MGTPTTLTWHIDEESERKVAETVVDNKAKKIYKKAKESVTADPITNRKSKYL